MGRQRLAPGEVGEINVTKQGKDARGMVTWRGRVYFADHSGVRRELVRTVTAERIADARTAIADAVAERLSLSEHVERWSRSMLLVDAVDAWLDLAKAEGKLSDRTMRDYAGAARRTIRANGSPVLGLTLAEANDVQRLQGFVNWAARTSGRGTARHARVVLSKVFAQAVAYRVLPSSELVKVSVPPAPSKTRRTSERDTRRGFTEGELSDIFALADSLADVEYAHPRSARKAEAVRDLLRFLDGTGVRLGEARNIRWSDVDLDRGTVLVRGTKTASALRHLTLPDRLVSMLRARLGERTPTGYVFGAPASEDGSVMWEQSNCSGALAKVLADAGCAWATPHTFRRTVATRLANAGHPVQRIADQLGHADPAETMSTYLARDLMGDKQDLKDAL